MTKEEICAALDAAGIEYDKRLSKDKLEALLEGEPAPVVAEVPMVPCVVQRDFWDAEGNRHPKGKVIRVSVEAALDGVESGALSRQK